MVSSSEFPIPESGRARPDKLRSVSDSPGPFLTIEKGIQYRWIEEGIIPRFGHLPECFVPAFARLPGRRYNEPTTVDGQLDRFVEAAFGDQCLGDADTV